MPPPPGNGMPVPVGGYVAEIGPLTYTVGSKKNPLLTLVGPAEPAALYRLEGSSLVAMSVGRTPGQARLTAMKKFPYPMLMTDAGGKIHTGLLVPGATLASIPFHHAYRGKLTADIAISTLLGKRSLPAGTVVYGYPAKSSLTVTVNGMPNIPTMGDDDYRIVNLELTWCAPVRGPAPTEIKPAAIGRGGWSAACIPHSMMGNHTILTDRHPAFALSSLSYDAGTSSNDGPPPIVRADDSAFERPLRIDYVFEGQETDFISLNERIYFGDELTSQQINKVYAPGGAAIVEIAGARLELGASPDGLAVKSTGALMEGANPALKWDRNALLMQQYRKMDLKPVEETAEVADPAS